MFELEKKEEKLFCENWQWHVLWWLKAPAFCEQEVLYFCLGILGVNPRMWSSRLSWVGGDITGGTLTTIVTDKCLVGASWLGNTGGLA